MSATGAGAANLVPETVEALLAEAPADKIINRRDETRHAFFSPATLFIRSTQFHLVFAFTRDISPEGIGLLHSVKLKPGEVTVMIHRPSGHAVQFRVHITWCAFCGEGWYLSGGRLLEVV